MNWVEYSRVLLGKCKQLGTPYYACFELTPFCNFKCDMCYVRLEPEQAKAQGRLLSTREWIRIAEETKAMGAIGLEVTGGEAVTRPDFPDLYEAFIKMGFLINLRSNGYLIDGERLALLKRYPPANISITLYGASDETYQKICGIENGFSVVTKNVLAIRDAGLNVKLSLTATRENVDDAKQVYEWATQNGIIISYSNGLITPIRGAKRSVEHLRLPVPDIGCTVTEDMLPEARDIPDREKYTNPFWMCRAFGAMFCVSWDGRMTVCNSFPAIWSDPLADGVQEAYKKLYHDLKALKRPKECEACQIVDFCSACPSQILSATGDPERTCEAICRRARQQYYLRFGEKREELIEDIRRKLREGKEDQDESQS